MLNGPFSWSRSPIIKKKIVKGGGGGKERREGENFSGNGEGTESLGGMPEL